MAASIRHAMLPASNVLRSHFANRRRLASVAAISLSASVSAAQSVNPAPIAVVPMIDTARALSAMSTLEFALNRPLGADDGELVLTVGGVDVTAFVERTGQGLVYRPTFAPIPAGNTEVVLFQKRGARWTELRRLLLTVRTVSGFTRIVATPSATLGNKGQVAEGRSRGIPEPERPIYQDVVFNGSLQSVHERSRFTLETSSAYVGSSRREEALRFTQQQERAPRLDLSDFRIVLRAGAGRLTIGQTSFGESRQLINGFSSRGASLAWARGGTRLVVGALNAAPLVGWDHLIGMDHANHRVLGASIARELIARRPGALTLDVTVLDASMLPLNGFRQGAVLDAEQSAGSSVQLSMTTPGQRMRFAGGVSRSRFDNPPLDPQLTGDTIVRALERESRGARFVESNVSVLQNRTVRGVGVVNLGLGYRHERVDPLYRSVAAPLQADRMIHGSDATFAVGVISGQAGWSWSRDNLGRISTILTTRDQSNSMNFAVPVAQLFRVKRATTAWPTITLAFNHVHQRADGEPSGDTFRPQDLPDQLSTNRDLGAQWQFGRWHVAARRNRSHQDNRQIDRERADFTAGSDALSVGTELGATADVALDLGDDFQRSEERGERTDTRRVTLNTNLRRGQGASLVLAVSLLHTRPPAGPTTINSEQRIELTQPLAMWRDATGGARGQLFVRFGRSTARLPDFLLAATDPMARISQRQWAVSSGLNLRVF